MTRSILVSVDDLPPEILATILSFIDFSKDSPSSIIKVASVCRRWRDLVYSRQAFWTALTIPAHIAPVAFPDANAVDEALICYMKRLFSRSGDLPLKLELKTGFTELWTPPQLTRLLALTSRLETLSITAYTPLRCDYRDSPWLYSLLQEALVLSEQQAGPCWRCLKFHSDSSFNSHQILTLEEVAPSLERLELIFDTCSDWSLSGPFVKMKALRHLRLEGHFLEATNLTKAFLILKTIVSTPQLESLVFHDQHDDDQRRFPVTVALLQPIIDTLPVSNLSLSHLDLWDNLGTRFSLCNLSLPALISLRLYRDYPTKDMSQIVTLDEAITQLLEKSICSLKTLRLEAVSPYTENLLETFRRLLTLEVIELRCGCAIGTNDHAQSLQFLHGLSTVSPNTSGVDDFLPALKEFVYHDDLLEAKYIPDLIVHFKSFVEHLSRRCGGATTVEAEFPSPRRGKPPILWRKRRPGHTTSTSSANEDDAGVKRFRPLEKAVLFAGGHTDPPVYSRFIEPAFKGAPEDAPVGADRLNVLKVHELKTLMAECGVSALCRKPKKQDAILTSLSPPTCAQIDKLASGGEG